MSSYLDRVVLNERAIQQTLYGDESWPAVAIVSEGLLKFLIFAFSDYIETNRGIRTQKSQFVRGRNPPAVKRVRSV